MPRPQFILRALLVALFALPTNMGCVRSEKPLVSEEESVIDADLLGLWEISFAEVDGGTCSVSIYPMPGSETVLEVAVEGEGDALALRMTKIGRERYLCLCDRSETDLYVILRYEVRGKQVRFYELDENATHNAIRNGELSGKAWYFFTQRAQLSGDTAEVRAYLEQHGKACFCFHSWHSIPSMERPRRK